MRGAGNSRCPATTPSGEHHGGEPARPQRRDRPGEDDDAGRNQNEIIRQFIDRQADRRDRKCQHGELAADRPGRARCLLRHALAPPAARRPVAFAIFSLVAQRLGATTSSTEPKPAMLDLWTSGEGPHHAIRRRPQEGRRHSDERREDAAAGGAAVHHLADDRDRGLLRDLDRGREPEDRRGCQADRPQGRPHLQGDAAFLADRRARLRAPAR